MDETLSNVVKKLYGKVSGWIEQLVLMLPNLLVAVLLFLLFYAAGKLLRKWLERPLRKLIHSQALVNLTLTLVSTTFVVVGLFVALSILQLDKAVTSLLAGAGIIGLALGFAFQDIAANFVSGVLMAVRKPIQIGDLIESNGHFGTVFNINLRSTIIRTQQGQHVHIPNKEIFNQPIINYSEEGKRRIDLTCGVSYGDDLEQVKQLTLQTIRSIEYLVNKEDITFFYTEFGESSINFVVRYWVDFHRQPDYLVAVSDGIIAIKKAFDAHHITIPFPIRTLDFGIKGGVQLTEQLAETRKNGK